MNPPRKVSSLRHFRAPAQDNIAPGPAKNNGRLVGVIADRAALAHATRLRRPPDFFELRLDALRDSLGEIERALPFLPAPLILTARHPAENGRGSLNVSARHALLRRFLPQAHGIDLELRSAQAMRSLIAEARHRKIQLILSSHDFRDTPTAELLREQLQTAIAGGADIFKIATRTDNAAQLDRLLTFFHESSEHFPIAAMGIGKLGVASRREFLRLGSALNYAAIGKPNAAGQPTLAQLRRTRAAYTNQ
ncbi:MAG: type I 3-dehydroquinate dehydratase [Chthoniobacterales bacterium]|nr:type I 3-dehydroquinate dehydratase [Chthoniobacterales bacterium]